MKKRLLPADSACGWPLLLAGFCGWPVLLAGLCLGVLVPLVISGAGRALTNRFLGRTMMPDTSVLRNTGMVVLLIGIGFVVLSVLEKRQGDVEK